MEVEIKHLDWMETMRRSVEEAATRHGWSWDDGRGYQRWNRSASGCSFYTTLQRERVVGVDADGFDEVEYQTVAVRVSNHPTAYCSEDISLVPEPSGDDHAFADLEKILCGSFVEERP